MTRPTTRGGSEKRQKAIQKEREKKKRRLSLPSTIDSATSVTQEKINKRRLSRRLSNASLNKSNNADEQEGKARPIPLAVEATNKENENSNQMKMQGPTPYYKVVQERGGQMSPRLTRSASKKKKEVVERPPLPDRGTKLFSSPPRDPKVFFKPDNTSEHECLSMNLTVPHKTKLDGFYDGEEASDLSSTPTEKTKEQQSRIHHQDMEQLKTLLKELREDQKADRQLHQDQLRTISEKSEKERTQMEQEKLELVRRVESLQSQLGGEDGALNEKIAALTESKELLLKEKFVLEQMNKEKTTEAQNLRKEIDSLEQQLNLLRETELMDAQAKLTKARELLETEKERANTLHCENERCKVQIDGLQAQLDGASNFEKVIRENESLRQKLSSAEQKTEATSQRLSAELETSQLNVKILETQIVPELESKVEEMSERLRTALGKVTSLESEISTSGEKVVELQDMVDAKTVELEALNSELEVVAEDNERLESELGDQKAAYDQTMMQLENLQESYDRIQKEILPKTQAQLAEAIDELDNQKTKEQRLEEERLTREQRISELEEQLAQSQETCKAERESFQELNQGTSGALEDLKTENKKLREELTRIQDTIAEKEKQIQEMNSSFREAMTQQEALSSERDYLQERLHGMRKDMETAQIEMTNRNDEASTQIRDLESRLEEASERLRRSEKNERAMKKRNEDLYSDVGRNLERIAVVEAELKETARERDEANNFMANFSDRERELHQRLVESDQVRRDLHAKVMQLMGNIRVFVRMRPFSPDAQHGKSRGGTGTEPIFKFPTVADRQAAKDVGPMDLTKKTLELIEPKKDRGGLKERRARHRFGFDNVFQANQGQDDVWESTEPLVQSAMDGHNVSLFAYGQTGSGKTYTMLGEPGNEGLVTRSIQKMFRAKREIEAFSKGQSQVDISVELLEIYNEQVIDLLSSDGGSERKNVRISLADHKIQGNKVAKTSTEEECMGLLDLSQKRRCVKATSSNAKSSRSHLVFTIHYEVSEDQMHRKGKLHICDLAGSERLSKSKAHIVGGELLQETKNINKSLSTLSNVIEQLQAGSKSVSFRESKLTSLLYDSLGGDSKTLAIICCSPLPSHYHESLSSLRFAEKASNVQLRASSGFSC